MKTWEVIAGILYLYIRKPKDSCYPVFHGANYLVSTACLEQVIRVINKVWSKL
jgi:hypothetical protein